MRYEEWLERVKEEIALYFPEIQKEQVDIVKNLRNEDALVIRREGETALALPLFPYFYERGPEETLSKLFARIAGDYQRLERETAPPKVDWQKVKEELPSCLFTKALPYETSRERLAGMPHRRIEDVAVTAFLSLGEEFSMPVTDSVVKMLSMDGEELLKAAIKNHERRYPAQLASLGETLASLDERLPIDEVRKSSPFFVLHSKEAGYAAAFLANDGVLSKVGKQLGEDYYILPSSIHELIILPKSAGLEAKELQALVREVNRTVVRTEEVLSDRVYGYDHQAHQVRTEAMDAPMKKAAKRMSGPRR